MTSSAAVLSRARASTIHATRLRIAYVYNTNPHISSSKARSLLQNGNLANLEKRMKIPTLRAGAHIEGIHWVAEYVGDVHEIRVFREGQEVDVHNAPSTLFGDEENAGSKSCADHRAAEAAVLAYLRRFVAEHEAEE
jgi:hypothetical protein